MSVLSEPGSALTVEATANWSSWMPVISLTNHHGRQDVVDPGATDAVHRFYRILSIPPP
jgi:hypothetical protein